MRSIYRGWYRSVTKLSVSKRSAPKLLTKNEARRIVVNIPKLPDLLKRGD